jgi:hypothetical protein
MALGVSPGRVESPFAPNQSDLVWSRTGQTWRQIRVVDQSWLMGLDPVSALWTAPGVVLFFEV